MVLDFSSLFSCASKNRSLDVFDPSGNCLLQYYNINKSHILL